MTWSGAERSRWNVCSVRYKHEKHPTLCALFQLALPEQRGRKGWGTRKDKTKTLAFLGPLAGSQARQHDSLLRLVFSLFIFVRNFAALVRLEENHLAQSLVRVNSCRQRRRVADFECDVPLPLRLERRHV